MTLYIREDCRTCARIHESLDDVAIAHETVVIPVQEQSDRLPEGTQTPVPVDDSRVIQDSRDVAAYIEELRQLREEWLKYQSDVCYCD